ncbi:MAG: hypothetical protein NZ942_02725 [Candidatus Aenigmarchaeota archaeon]|nr:hypothetical protein [Candidatus Aenigmarchaeota archaeon]
MPKLVYPQNSKGGENVLEEMSGWAIFVWDCHGTVRPLDAEDYKSVKAEAKYVKVGYFSVPVPRETRETEKLKEELEKWCWKVLSAAGGAINWSRVYHITLQELSELSEIVSKFIEE